MLEREAEQHAGVACDPTSCRPGFAAVNGDFARRAVGMETDGDRNSWFQNRRSRSLRPGAGEGSA